MDNVEAMACRRAIEFAIENGLQQALFEGDSLTVINYIQAGPPCLASFGHIIEDAINLTSHLCYCSFSHVLQKGNTVADKVAKLAKVFFVPKIWKEDISIRSRCSIKKVILTHQKPTLLFYHIILQHPIYQMFYHSIIYIKIIFTTH